MIVLLITLLDKKNIFFEKKEAEICFFSVSKLL
jgi:hypothetical protein